MRSWIQHLVRLHRVQKALYISSFDFSSSGKWHFCMSPSCCKPPSRLNWTKLTWRLVYKISLNRTVPLPGVARTQRSARNRAIQSRRVDHILYNRTHTRPASIMSLGKELCIVIPTYFRAKSRRKTAGYSSWFIDFVRRITLDRLRNVCLFIVTVAGGLFLFPREARYD